MGLRSFAKYLWSNLVVKLGLHWWGVALVAGVVAYALYSLRVRKPGEGRGKAYAGGLLAAYVVVVTAATVLSRVPRTPTGHNLLVAGGFANLLRGGRMGPDALANALMLLPVGMLLPVLTGWRLKRTTFASLAFSVWIEAAQLVCCLGYPELYDVFLNTLGAMVGYSLWTLLKNVANHTRSSVTDDR